MTAFALYSAFERAHDLSRFWAFVFLGFRLRFALGSPFFPRRIALALASPRLNSLPGLKLNSRSCGLLPSRAQLNPRPYAHEPPSRPLHALLGVGYPFDSGFCFGLPFDVGGLQLRL